MFLEKFTSPTHFFSIMIVVFIIVYLKTNKIYIPNCILLCIGIRTSPFIANTSQIQFNIVLTYMTFDFISNVIH